MVHRKPVLFRGKEARQQKKPKDLREDRISTTGGGNILIFVSCARRKKEKKRKREAVSC
jgi:hypothetical protein